MPRGRLPLWAFAFAIASAGSGCKSDDDPGAAFVGRYCDIYKPCCTAAGLPGDGAACRALFASSSSAKAKYDATQGDACISGLMQQSSQPGFCEGSIVPPSACARAFGGATGDCVQDSDCAPSSQGDVRCVAATVSGQTVPKCQVQIRGTAGATPCIGTVRGGVTLYAGTSGDTPDQGYICDVADGLRCDGTACIALTAEGAPCELSDNCALTAFCDATTGTCAARKAVGASCIDQALECQDGAYCNTSGGMTCAAQGDVGAACTENVQCLTGNCPNGTCAAIPTGGANAICGG